MTDDDIIQELRAAGRVSSATKLATLFNQLAPEPLTQGTLVTCFARAFPEIPLRILLEAGAWHRLSSGTLSDLEFDMLLSKWLPTGSR